jgi:hypothetical protein
MTNFNHPSIDRSRMCLVFFSLSCFSLDVTAFQTVHNILEKLSSSDKRLQGLSSAYVLRVCGRTQYVLDNVEIHRLEYVRHCLERRQRVEFHLIPLASLSKWLNFNPHSLQSQTLPQVVLKLATLS